MNEEKHRLFVRIITSSWHDNNGLYQKKSIKILKRKSCGHDFLLEEASMTGSNETFERIKNLHECQDGIYEVIIVNIKRDWETGAIDDYDFSLLKHTN